MTITSRQVSEARKLLGWSKRTLASKISTNFNAVHAYEIEGRISEGFRPERARSALEAAGVEFIDPNGGGAGVRVRKDAS